MMNYLESNFYESLNIVTFNRKELIIGLIEYSNYLKSDYEIPIINLE